MAWDFSTEPEFQEQLDWVEEFCRTRWSRSTWSSLVPRTRASPKARALADPLKQQVKDRGLWALFLDRDLGGPGFGQLKLALLNEILGRYRSAPVVFGTAAPDTGNMEMLAAYGTPEQKSRWLVPLMNQEIFSAYSMTEPQGGSDPSLFKTHAARDGDEWVINGEKWFTSAGARADIIFVMCVNGMFVVPREAPGVEISRVPALHNHIRYNEVRVPADHLLGTRGRREGAGAAPSGRRPHPSRDAHRGSGQAGVRHHVRAGAQPGVARQGHRRAPDGAGGDRRLLRGDQHAAAAGAVDGLDDRQLEHAARPAPRSPPASTPAPRCCARSATGRCTSWARSARPT